MPTRPPKSSLSTRGLKLMWRNPRMAHTLLREEYRKKFGIQLDRRFRDGLSGPPANLNLNLTRRCNLKCRMCEQHRHASDPTGLPWRDKGVLLAWPVDAADLALPLVEGHAMFVERHLADR